MSKVYIVTDNSGFNYDGDEYSIIGVFSSIENATIAAKKYVEEHRRKKDTQIQLDIIDSPYSVTIHYDDGVSDYSFVKVSEYELDIAIW